MTLSFSVAGDPKPQGSKRAFITKQGRAVLVEQAGQPLKDWRLDVAHEARRAADAAGWTTTVEPVCVNITFRLRSPKKPNHEVPTTRPDIDKLIRSVLDAITTASIWRDDSQVVRLHATKQYGEPGVEVEIWEL